MLILGLGVLSVIGHGGMPQSVNELLQKQNLRKLIISGAIVIGGAIVLTVATVEKLVDLVLNVLGLGIVVIVLSAISMVHAGLVLFTGDGRGILKFM
jgi:tartrate dehydratase beta subunit/fumarate hydratase class I family protein